MSQEAHSLSNNHKAAFTLLTINLLSGAARWEVRRELLAEQLQALAPDVIAMQEVSRPAEGIDPAAWLASRMGYPHVYLTWQPPGGLGEEGIALISRSPLEQRESLRLNGQNRVAQRALFRVDGRPVCVANTHLFWQPGDSPERLAQVEAIVAWLHAMPERPPCVIAGDFNGTPETRAIRRMAAVYPSAYAAVHGHEPARTFPTPLKRSRVGMLRGVLRLLPYVRLQQLSLRQHALQAKATLDYIFVDPRLHPAGCRLVLDQPDANDPELYPSDHYGLMAAIHITS